jgi:hypothetical protein
MRLSALSRSVHTTGLFQRALAEATGVGPINIDIISVSRLYRFRNRVHHNHHFALKQKEPPTSIVLNPLPEIIPLYPKSLTPPTKPPSQMNLADFLGTLAMPSVPTSPPTPDPVNLANFLGSLDAPPRRLTVSPYHAGVNVTFNVLGVDQSKAMAIGKMIAEAHFPPFLARLMDGGTELSGPVVPKFRWHDLTLTTPYVQQYKDYNMARIQQLVDLNSGHIPAVGVLISSTHFGPSNGSPRAGKLPADTFQNMVQTQELQGLHKQQAKARVASMRLQAGKPQVLAQPGLEIIVIVLIALLLAAGYFFANRKSQREMASESSLEWEASRAPLTVMGLARGYSGRDTEERSKDVPLEEVSYETGGEEDGKPIFKSKSGTPQLKQEPWAADPEDSPSGLRRRSEAGKPTYMKAADLDGRGLANEGELTAAQREQRAEQQRKEAQQRQSEYQLYLREQEASLDATGGLQYSTNEQAVGSISDQDSDTDCLDEFDA